MSTKKISELETTSAVSTSDLMETAIPSGSSYASKKMSIAQLATYLENSVVHSALDTQNKTIIDAINELKSICDSLSASHFIVANQLPTSDINMNAIYLIPKQSTGVNDVYEEYICLDDTTTPATWEKIGETQIDLSNYITFDDADIATTSKNGSMSKADRSKMNGIESGAQKNVQSDWNASSGDAFIKHKPTIPSALADLTDDSTHRVVTDSEKSTWNDKRAVNLELTNEDLDDVKTVGFYVGKSGNTCANKPSGVNQFGLFVIRTATSGTGNYYKQTLIRPNASGETWSRSCVNGAWSTWKQEIFTDENVKQSQLGSTNSDYPLLMAYSANGTEETKSVWKDTNITYNPSSNTFNVSNGTVKAYTGQYSELVSTFIGFMSGSTLLAYFSPNPNQASGTTVEAVMPATSGTLALQSELLNKLSWEENKASGVKNYFIYPYNHPMQGETYNIRAVDYTDNGDGGIKANGTCDNTGDSYCQLLPSATINAGMHRLILPKGHYHFSGGISNDYYINLSRGILSNPSADRTPIGEDKGDGFDFEVTEQQSKECYFCSFCFVKKNKTATNVVFYPMITRYEDTSDGYAIYAMTNTELTQMKADMENIASVETGATASKAYAVGDYMWWRHGFYRVTQAITSGGAIISSGSGTNVIKTTLGAELKRALT